MEQDHIKQKRQGHQNGLTQDTIHEEKRPLKERLIQNISHSGKVFQSQRFNSLFSASKQTKLSVQLSAQCKRVICIFIIMIVMMLFISFWLNYKVHFENFLTMFPSIEAQKHQGHSWMKKLYKISHFVRKTDRLVLEDSQMLKKMYDFCPNQNSTFHVYYDQNDEEMNGLDVQMRKKAEKCRVPILQYKDLHWLKRKWNIKYPHQLISLGQYKLFSEKKRLLLLLHLYFHAGTYLDISIPYFSVDNRCWKYVLNGFESLYGDYKQKTQNGIYIPGLQKLVKVIYPYSPQIRIMIRKTILKEDFRSQCREKQCLIVKCIKE